MIGVSPWPHVSWFPRTRRRRTFAGRPEGRRENFKVDLMSGTLGENATPNFAERARQFLGGEQIPFADADSLWRELGIATNFRSQEWCFNGCGSRRAA